VDCNIEIGSVVGLVQSLVEVDMIHSPLINTPLQRGDLWGADLPTVSTVSQRPRGAKTVKTVAIRPVIAATQLKLGVNEKLLSKLVLQVTGNQKPRF